MHDRACVLHITDSHLYGDPRIEKDGLNPLDTLKKVLVSAVREHSPHAIIHTGDTANDATESTYERFLETVRNEIDAPMICTPGNHDLSEPFHKVCPTDDLEVGNWFITTVDSHVDHEVGGHIPETNLQKLGAKLENQTNHTLIATHHPPAPIGVSWIDGHRIDNGEALLELCAADEVVKGLVCGHVHQEHHRSYGTFQVMTTPSTCWQFGEDSNSFSYSDKPPGWRWLFLHETGTITTEVGRISNQ